MTTARTYGQIHGSRDRYPLLYGRYVRIGSATNEGQVETSLLYWPKTIRLAVPEGPAILQPFRAPEAARLADLWDRQSAFLLLQQRGARAARAFQNYLDRAAALGLTSEQALSMTRQGARLEDGLSAVWEEAHLAHRELAEAEAQVLGLRLQKVAG